MSQRTIGVEEELLVVDPRSGHPRALGSRIVERASGEGRGQQQGHEHREGHGPTHGGREATARMDTEFKCQQVEVITRPCATLDELAEQVANRRAAAAEAARAEGVAVAALGTSPVATEPVTTPGERYRRLAEQYALTAREQLTQGLHVHVRVDSPEEGVGVLDRLRPWLPALRAIAVNSPFWQTQDTGYASYRSLVWNRWPSAGPAEPFGTVERYRSVVDQMVSSGVLLDRAMIYFDARLSEHFPTVEIRVADVCLEPDDTVLVAALARALVSTAARDLARGEPVPPVRVEMLRMAHWRAARSGLSGDLVDPLTGRPLPARDHLAALLHRARFALEAVGDASRVDQLLKNLLERGTGADLQRAAHARRGRLADVVRDAVARTAG